MASTKSSGATKSIRDSESKRLGVKKFDGEYVKPGDIIIRQRGTKFVLGKNVALGKDYTIYALTEGRVKFKTLRKKLFDGNFRWVKQVNVISS